jgi:hypothetical protein
MMMWELLVVGIVVAAAVAAHDFLHGQRLIPDLWEEWRIARADLAALDRANLARADRSDIIVSLTTIPSRLLHIDDTLKSLLRQTRPPAEIRLYVPTFSARENRAYEIPERLRRLACVTIHTCSDLGPATKFIPALTSLPPDQPVLAVDDDRIYPPNLVADLEAAARARPDAAYGFSGWIAPRDLIDKPTTVIANLLERPPVPIYAQRQRRPRPVDVLQGTGGYLIRPGFFALDRLVDYSAAPAAARSVDDVWMSAHCKVDKFVIPARRSNFQARRRMAIYKRTSLGRVNRGKRNEERKNSIMLRYFADRWMLTREHSAGVQGES